MADSNIMKSTVIKNANPLKVSQEMLFDDRIQVARPDVFPNRCVGQIEIKLRNGTILQASGSLISDYTVLTAGHVVKGANNQFLDIETFRFIPARNHSNMPYGIYDWSEMRAVYNGGSRDWALISLTQPAGFQTGFLGTSAKFPVNRWANERDHFQHIGFPGDHTDEMWIDEDGVCTGIHDNRQLKTDIDAAHGQSGGPLTISWFSNNPQVCGCLSWGPNPIEDPNYFTPGYEDVKTDVWMQWLCDEYGKKHPDDRFSGCQTHLTEGPVETKSMLPNYDIPHVFTDDKGPGIRRFTPRATENWMTPHRARLMMNQQDKKL
ncbi:trypsin-like serine peptidase [Lysinibacillus sp. NPDC048646]|uniref:trypsin-like serine peptidase n=1 Tax=Lysinibacillus sp. NPDC048646 TaxID=3390574 RepID=UPI003D005DCA